MPSEIELAGRIFFALLLGGLIGFEREATDQHAGLRTHISVALGAALFGIVSAYGFEYFGDLPRDQSSYQVDVTRVASTVVTGVGFLGGGAILKHGATVRGLTTAASLWVTAAIGLAASLGLYVLSAVTTFALLVSLVGLRGPRRWIEQRFGRDREQAVFTLKRSADPSGLIAALHGMDGIEVHSLSISTGDDGIVVRADLQAVTGDLETKLAHVAERSEVEELDLGE